MTTSSLSDAPSHWWGSNPNKIPFILQANTSPERIAELLIKTPARQWIYLGEDARWCSQVERLVGDRLPRLSLISELHRTSWTLREPFIEWIGELSTINGSLEWWASGLAEKNPFSKLYPRICQLAVGRECLVRDEGSTVFLCSSLEILNSLYSFTREIGKEPIIVNPSGSPLHEFIQTVQTHARSSYHALRHLAGLSKPAVPSWSPEELVRRRRLLNKAIGPLRDEQFEGSNTALLMTWVDWRNFATDGSYRDPHFGYLPQMLKEQGLRLAYVPRVLPSMPFREAIEALRKSGERFFFPEMFLSPKSVDEFVRRAEAYRPVIPEDSRVGDIPVAALARMQAEDDRRYLANTLLYEPLVAHMAAAGVRPRLVYFMCEGQGWERVLTQAVRRFMPQSRIVGVDSGIFSSMHLSMFMSEMERKTRPLPDRIVVPGVRSQELYVSDERGLSADLVKVGCAARFLKPGDLLESAQPRLERNADGPVRVLVTTSIHTNDAIEQVGNVLAAFGEDSKYRIILKFHPAVDVATLTHVLRKKLDASNVLIEIRTVEELLKEADLMLYTYTKVCLDALASGVPPVFMRREHGLNLDQLESIPEIRWVSDSPKELRSVVDEIASMSSSQRKAWAIKARMAVSSFYSPVTSRCVEAFVA